MSFVSFSNPLFNFSLHQFTSAMKLNLNKKLRNKTRGSSLIDSSLIDSCMFCTARCRIFNNIQGVWMWMWTTFTQLIFNRRMSKDADVLQFSTICTFLSTWPWWQRDTQIALTGISTTGPGSLLWFKGNSGLFQSGVFPINVTMVTLLVVLTLHSPPPS